MTKSPVIIFGTGGSGTRIVAKIVRSASYNLGKNVNSSEDALDIAFFLNRQANKYLMQSKWLNGQQIEKNLDKIMIKDFKEAITKHKSGIKEKWGWKNPRGIYMFPFFHKQYPNMLAIHVVRDGRDMAFSFNQNQLRIHGPFILSGNQFSELEPIQSMSLWAITNLIAFEYGTKYLKENYLCIRFEDLCQEPAATTKAIFNFFGDNNKSHKNITLQIKPPDTIGRWKKKDYLEIDDLCRKALDRFGYLS